MRLVPGPTLHNRPAIPLLVGTGRWVHSAPLALIVEVGDSRMTAPGTPDGRSPRLPWSGATLPTSAECCPYSDPVRLLMVEDEERLAASLAAGLRAEGYAVDVAHDGWHGFHLAQGNRYAAVILDIMLPGLNGFRVCARLRAAGSTVPILMLTAKDGEYDEAEALDTGADDYLSKPFSQMVLLARLRALVRRGGAVRSSALMVGDLWLDPASRRCRRGETQVRLTMKEFAVLECLALRPTEVVAKTEILDAVWDQDFRGDANIVEVYVHALRRKLDVPFGRRSIETVRGAGYRLVQDA